MEISPEELEADGFRRAGTVFPDADRKVRVEVDWDVTGFVVYIMVVDGDFKKAGTTGRRASRFKGRMHSTFSALRQVMMSDPPYLGDPFKQRAPFTIIANREVELWARQYPSFESMIAKETELNNKYQPEWTKEGRHRAKEVLGPSDGRCECGCGAEVRGTEFLPGHDQKLRIQIERRVGGLLALRDIVHRLEGHANGESTADDLSAFVKSALSDVE